MSIPADPVAKMREVPIYCDRDHPLGGAHFHPSDKWLADHEQDSDNERIANVRKEIEAAKANAVKKQCVTVWKLPEPNLTSTQNFRSVVSFRKRSSVSG